MSDLKITDLAALAEADVATGDLLPIVDVSADETKKVTAGDLITASIDFLASGAIPIAKVDTTGISLAADSVGSSQISTGAVGSDELATGSVTNAKLASGSLTADKFGTQAANVVLAGPTGGVDATPTFRALDAADIPIATTTALGGVIVPTSGGLAVDGAGNVTINNSVTPASLGWIDHDADGLITASRALLGSDVPVATTSTRGTVAVNGFGLAMSGNEIRHSNSVVGTDLGFVTYDDQGHITAGRPILPFDLPPATVSDPGAVSVGSGLSVTALGELSVGLGDASTVGGYALGPEFSVNGSNQLTLFSVATNLLTGLITNGQLDTGAVDGTNLATQSTCKIASSLPAGGDYTGQLFYNTTNADLLLWDGNAYRTVSTAGGTLVLAGTYDASTNLLDSVTAEGTAVGYVNGAALPSASATNKGYYVVVSQSGTGVAPAPLVTLDPPELLLSTGTSYQLIENSQTISNQIASNISFTPVGSIAATNVQSALAEVDSEKLANTLLSGRVFVGSSSNVATGVAITGDITISNTGVVGIASGVIVDADVNVSAAITGTKIQAGSTSVRGTVQLTDSTSSTSTTTAATPNAVKSAYDLAAAALPKSGGTMTGAITFAAGQTITGYGLLDGAQTWTKGQRGEITTLTDAATITPDFADSNNFQVTLAGNRTLANPTNLVAGQSGCVWITQDATGSHTLAFDTYWDFSSGTAPTLTTTANAVDCLVYAVQSATRITATLIANLS